MSRVECIDPQMGTNFSTRSVELDTRLVELNTRSVELDTRSVKLDTRLAELDTRSVELDTRYQIGFENPHVCGNSLFTCHVDSFKGLASFVHPDFHSFFNFQISLLFLTL